MEKTLQFWFDFASPYAFIAETRLFSRLEKTFLVEYQPFLVGAALNKKTGGASSTQLTTPAESRYRKHDILRTCATLNIPIAWPSTYPRGSLPALRVAFLNRRQSWIATFIHEVFRANFILDRNIEEPDVVNDILNRMGLDGREIMRAILDETVKSRFHAHVDRAMDQGIFGVPTFVVDGELFWGNDRLEQAIAWLRHDHASTTPPKSP